MPTFGFAISPNAIAQLHDALSCLAKFDENISLEATAQELRISSLNSSKTAYASFIFNSTTFFDKYHFSASSRSTDSEPPKSWACKLQNRALLSIFKKRQVDNKEKETSVERCEFELYARPDETECRLIIKLYCRFSVIKTYRLTYESAEVLHATFDKQGSPNTWTISSRTLRDVVEYFGPKTEHVDWSLHDGKVTFTSYTDKIQVGREIIRQPTHTSVTLNGQDFDECKIEQDLHISIPVKDFRSIVAHADTMKANVKVVYSRGHRPSQITYGSGGLTAEFTLMTKGTSSTAIDSSRTATPARGLSVRPTSQPATSSRAHSISRTTQSDVPPAVRAQPDATMPAPSHNPEQNAKPKLRNAASADTSAPPASINPDSLFFPAAEDDDQQWDPQNFDEPDMVTWDNTGANSFDPSAISGRRLNDAESGGTSFKSALEDRRLGPFEIAPTQRLSQIKGMFD
ncbi:hypothetical protein OHC33_003694 [Knufia fluminis]|uniref:DNA repair protein rad9 n=1 Tax=Knufia fluminis TaxID=191047 RepID=A0AAN8EIX5_9EURO|nr:hypothetical protein OHC33_003694 [Knufia fluminis]